MILEELKIEGFRSLKSVTWKPGRLNVLIGPNGGGKSNLLSALDLLRYSATEGFRDAVLSMGGMGALVWDGQASEIRFDLGFDDSKRQKLVLRRVGLSGGFQVGESSAITEQMLRYLDDEEMKPILAS